MTETQIESIKIARMEPGDVLVLTCPQTLTIQQRDHLRASIDALGMPGRVVVLDGGMQVSIVSPASSCNLSASPTGK